jgi:anti-sigma B factor antagonist
MLTYSGHDADGVMVFTVEEGEPGRAVMAQREWLYRTIAERDDRRFVIDLRSVRYMASADVGVLLTVKRRIDSHKGRVVLANVDPFLLDIFRSMRLDKVFTIAPDLAAALRAVST